MMANTQRAPAPYMGHKALVVSSLALALSSASFLVFRGPISLVSALLVPSILVVFLRKSGRAYEVITYIALMIMVLLFFQTQVVFAFGYILLALAFKAFVSKPGTQVGRRILQLLLHVVLVALVLFICIILTEAVLGVPLHSMMMRMSRQNPAIYVGILLLEATLVCTVNILLIKSISARLHA